MSYLDALEQEAIYIIRESVAEFRNPVMLYSIGKDSSVLRHLALKAFGKLPFPLLHVDTTLKFKEMISFRDKISETTPILVHTNTLALEARKEPWTCSDCAQQLKTEALIQAIRLHEFDAALSGARRDEEKSRAKERIFSFRDIDMKWNPYAQRPEFWDLYNTKHNIGETFRVFPLSNWTELDIWKYIAKEKIEIVPLYFAKIRSVVEINNKLMLSDAPEAKPIMCRFRTLGCQLCTGAIRSTAATVEDIIDELELSKTSEREHRLVDQDMPESMEIKKMGGYF